MIETNNIRNHADRCDAITVLLNGIKSYPVVIQDPYSSRKIDIPDVERRDELIKGYAEIRDEPSVIVRWRGGKSEPLSYRDAAALTDEKQLAGIRVQLTWADGSPFYA